MANDGLGSYILDGASPFITYLGNGSNTVSNADVLTIDVLENYARITGIDTFFEGAGGYFFGPLATGSSLQGQGFVDGQPLPVMGPFAYPGPFRTSTIRGPLSAFGNPLLIDFRVTATFSSGSGVGAAALVTDFGIVATSTAVPEPGSLSLLGSGLLGTACAIGLRRCMPQNSSLNKI